MSESSNVKKEIGLRGLQKLVQSFCEERDWDQFHSAKNLAIGLVTEASELLELFRFHENCDHVVKEKREEVSDELADVFFFLLRFAQRNDIDLAEALTYKLKKNAEKYPIYKSKGTNKKYTEL